MRVLASPARIVVAAWLAAAAAVSPIGVSGQVRLLVPEQSPSGPFYARLERGVVHQTDEWVAIAFYRDPSCVRPAFNLLNFFDFANIPAIFSCPLTVSGFEIWDDPSVDPAPRQNAFRGDGAVPVWFVSVGDFAAALPGITITELRAMPSLMQGTATFFEERLHPAEVTGEGFLQIVAHGYVPDGRVFHYVAIETEGELRHVQVTFR